MSEWASERVSEWASEWVSGGWVNEWASEWLSEWVSECVRERASEWVSECVLLGYFVYNATDATVASMGGRVDLPQDLFFLFFIGDDFLVDVCVWLNVH